MKQSIGKWISNVGQWLVEAGEATNGKGGLSSRSSLRDATADDTKQSCGAGCASLSSTVESLAHMSIALQQLTRDQRPLSLAERGLLLTAVNVLHTHVGDFKANIKSPVNPDEHTVTDNVLHATYSTTGWTPKACHDAIAEARKSIDIQATSKVAVPYSECKQAVHKVHSAVAQAKVTLKHHKSSLSVDEVASLTSRCRAIRAISSSLPLILSPD